MGAKVYAHAHIGVARSCEKRGARKQSALLRLAYALSNALLELIGLLAQLLGRFDIGGRARIRIGQHADDADEDCLDCVHG